MFFAQLGYKATSQTSYPEHNAATLAEAMSRAKVKTKLHI
jgi:hypothetical protein